MKSKQIAGLIIAGIIFIAAGVSSVFSHRMASGLFENTLHDSMKDLVSAGINYTLPTEEFIGIVDVQGTIQDAGSSTAFDRVSYDHQNTLRYIDEMIYSGLNCGILLRVNSPGGTVYHSDELYLKLKEYKEITERPIWAYMESEACSGGYYVCMAADRICANRNAWTGSIGVIISYLNYSELLDEIGIEEINITSGPNKAMGSSADKLTKQQRKIMQSLVDESYEQFVEIVAEGRGLPVEKVRPLADGRLYTAKQALEKNLIDEIGAWEEFQDEILSEFDYICAFYQPSFYKETLLSSLFSAYKGTRTKSDAQLLSEFLKKEGNGAPLYYAGK